MGRYAIRTYCSKSGNFTGREIYDTRSPKDSLVRTCDYVNGKVNQEREIEWGSNFSFMGLTHAGAFATVFLKLCQPVEYLVQDSHGHIIKKGDSVFDSYGYGSKFESVSCLTRDGEYMVFVSSYGTGKQLDASASAFGLTVETV